MNNWQVDFFTELQKANTMQDVLDVTMKIIKPIGFDFCNFRSLLPLPMTRPNLITYSTTEDKIYKKEQKGDYLETPMSRHCARSMTPFTWEGTTEDVVFKAIPEMCEEYYSLGHRGGWAQSLVERKNMYSVFFVDSSDSLTSDYFDSVNLKMQWIATAVLSRMNQVKEFPNIILSRREKEILCWTGDGKTADQIAEILNISASTVNFHLHNTMKKLDAPNKIAAVVKAMFFRLLF